MDAADAWAHSMVAGQHRCFPSKGVSGDGFVAHSSRRFVTWEHTGLLWNSSNRHGDYSGYECAFFRFEIESRILSTLNIQLTDSLHHSLEEISKNDNISISQFISAAVAEKIAAMEGEDYIDFRAKFASEGSFKSALAKVRDEEPGLNDF